MRSIRATHFASDDTISRVLFCFQYLLVISVDVSVLLSVNPSAVTCFYDHEFRADGNGINGVNRVYDINTGNVNVITALNESLPKCGVDCVHGYCSVASSSLCVCELGWTGSDCGTSCGCNNHSTCVTGVGVCDKCQDWTEGERCERCVNGSYGNATTMPACKLCNCNGHGDHDRGSCDPLTGHCYCLHNTDGVSCERCESGYYGDPKHGGKCYLECLARGVISDAVNGSFGSKIGYISGSSQLHCLWIFTVHKTFDTSNLHALTRNSNLIPTPLSITIERNIRVECPYSHIQVFDGVPEFVANGGLKKKLGYYCGQNLREDIYLVAYSGFLTVFFERHDPNQGFNASYMRLDCLHCLPEENRECVNGSCVCANNYSGPNCQTISCPNNCSADKSQGTCDAMNGRCVCMPKYGNNDCSLYILPNRIVWSTLFNCEASSAFLPTLATYLPRMGHTLESTETAIWTFGGYSTTRGQLADIFKFNLMSSRWEEIKATSRKRDGLPQARHFHATQLVGDFIFLFGGLSQVNGVLGDFWCFKITEQMWIKLATMADIPPLAGHTLTAFGNKLLLIGGYSPSYGFLEKQFEYDIIDHQWKVFNSSGAPPTGIYGHTSVYHFHSHSIYVYGGIVYDIDRTVISGELYALHLSANVWYRLPPDEQINPIGARPLPRYFHAAVTTEFYMIIIGGRGFSNRIISSIYAYIYKCNKWISFEMDGILISGEQPSPAVGLSATIQSNNLYVFGGYNGQTNGDLKKLSLPKDLCQLFSHSRLGCLRHIGCSYCAVYEYGINRTFCYSQDLTIPASCFNPKGASEVAQGISCGIDLLERRNCYQYKSCIDCVAVWPSYSNARQVCQWCSNCQQGRCIPSGSLCERETECNLPQRVVLLPYMCPLRSCVASDCEKCTAINICMWTRQVLRSSELGHTLNVKPIFDWTCVRRILQNASSFPVESMPPLSCPPRCHQHINCNTCLESVGGEGGFHECSWSEESKQCMSPSFVRLRCEAGLCGSIVLQGSRVQCPLECIDLPQASHCLSRPHCGWCAFNGSRVDGRGVCMEGGMFGPINGICKLNQVVVFGRQLPSEVSHWMAQSDGPPFWAYLEKPKENECLNEHHTCDERHEECVDLEDGFMCRCKQGYIIDANHCKPTCNKGCIFGTCIAPDVCQCNFGYIGTDCSLACECNGHSNCAGVNRLGDCLECQNHTQGTQCQKCKPFFVGNPVNSGKCLSCKVFCNFHSDICLPPELFNNTLLNLNTISSTEELADVLPEGPLSEAICLNCKHNTQGEKCDQCIAGYFKATDNIRDGCRQCQCNSHGDMCSPLNGENCNCQNNTENDRQCNQKNSKNLLTPCWQLQCSKCKEYFLGVPTNGHQCYRHMFLDKDYCFDPNAQEECTRKPNALLLGRTVFFAVQPRYMNVDIRIVVDVTEGGVDFFLSAKEDVFVIDVNRTTGIHNVWLDKKYSTYRYNDDENLDKLIFKREYFYNETSNDSPATDPTVSNPTQPAPQSWPALKLRHHFANELTYYITVTDPNEFIVVRSLQHRLIITIPQEVHDLRSTRFYMVLRGVGADSALHTHGNMFFRQDQSRIDLFVFFSVFFSCFFLFLAACVVVWKIKQAFDLRRARRLHAAEMKHMASRPFAVILTYIDPSDYEDFEFALSSPTHHIHGNVKKGRGFRFKGSHSSLKDSPKSQACPELAERYLIRPVAVEPTSDGYSAVVTTLIQLPGGISAPIRLSLASTLVTVRGSHHILNLYHNHNNSNNVSVGAGVWRAAMRRRAHLAF